MNAEERIAATAARLPALYEEDGIGLSAYGELLILLGAVERLAAHADCTMDVDWDGDDPEWWKDATGRVWTLKASYRDRHGDLWRYAGGFHAAPDCQPLMWGPDLDVPLCHVVAVVGPLEVRS